MRAIAIIMLTASIGTFPTEVRYEEVFHPHYDRALATVRELGLKEKLQSYHADPHLAAATVFPEIVRYSIIRDAIETNALKVFYINLGDRYADFSIGLFQMKPSFIEALEKEIANIGTEENNQLMNKATAFSSSNPKEKRRERVRRLENVDWQIMYLACFYHITARKFIDTTDSMSNEEKVRFYAGAYNCGFHRSVGQIINCSKSDMFPYGKAAPPGRRYNYADIALYYYLHSD